MALPRTGTAENYIKGNKLLPKKNTFLVVHWTSNVIGGGYWRNFMK